MDTIEAKHVVLGAGAMGSAAAYHLARRGEPVLLVDRFPAGHTRGSSHGAARITRHSYADPRYARRMPAAFAAWRDLEADAGTAFFVRTGGVSFGPGDCDYVARVAANLDDMAIPHRRLDARELARVQPAFAVPPGYDAVFEPDAGLLAAARAIAAQVELARRHGGPRTTVLEGVPIRAVDLQADRPTLVADSLRIVADRLIVTAGAWTARLLPRLGLPLRPTRQQVLYFRPADATAFAIGRFPVWIFKGPGDEDAFYGMPDFLATGVKAARHGGPDVDPDDVRPDVDDDYNALLRRFLRGHIPALAEAPLASSEVCLYTVAPGDDFLIGPIPGRPDVIVASPCSGHGFKFSNLIGRMLADLAATGRTDDDLAAWCHAPG